MTRFVFGGGPEDVYLIQDTSTGFFKPGGGAQALFYSDSGKANRITDLQNIGGQAVTSVTTENGSGIWAAGQIAPFIGPDGVTEMYVSVAGSPPFLMQASQFGSYALPLLAQLIQLINKPAASLVGLTDTDSSSINAATTGMAVVKLSSGLWGAGTVASGGGGTGDVTLAGAQTFTGAKTFNALTTLLGGEVTKPLTAAGVARIVQALASQSGNLDEWRNSAGTAMAWVDSAGNAYFPNSGRTLLLSKAGAIATGVGSMRVYNDTGVALKFRSVRASVGTVSTSGTPTFDVNVAGTSIFGTQANRPTIPVSSNTSGAVTGFTAGSSIPAGSYVTVDIDVAGTGTADAVVQLEVW